MEFYLFIATWTIEITLMARWTSFYYRSGIPVFRKKFRMNDQNIHSLSAELLERSLTNTLPKYLFKNLAPETVVFRISLKQPPSLGAYTPFMRGIILVNRSDNSLSIIGYLHYFPIVFFIAMAIWSKAKPPIMSFTTAFVFIAILGLYFFERKKFEKIFQYATSSKSLEK